MLFEKTEFKKFLSVTLIAVYCVFTPITVQAAKKPITDEKTIDEYVNIEWWKGFNDAILLDYVIKAIQ